MFTCNIADFAVTIRNRYSSIENISKDYLISDANCDLYIRLEKEELHDEINKADQEYNLNYIEEIATYRKIAEWLPSHNAFVLHSACFDVDGVGVAFAAHSGTGKTTHMNLWQQLLGEKMTVVNGDKPIVRFFEDEPATPYAYGTPWNGKEHLGCNMRTVLKHICFIERSQTNFVEKIDKKDAINLIFNQVYMPKDPIAAVNTMQLIDRLLSCCNLWKIHCNMEPEAAKVAYNTILNSKKEG